MSDPLEVQRLLAERRNVEAYGMSDRLRVIDAQLDTHGYVSPEAKAKAKAAEERKADAAAKAKAKAAEDDAEPAAPERSSVTGRFRAPQSTTAASAPKATT